MVEAWVKRDNSQNVPVDYHNLMMVANTSNVFNNTELQKRSKNQCIIM